MDFEFIYKICTKDEWIKAKNEGRFLGSVKDLKDGFQNWVEIRIDLLKNVSKNQVNAANHLAGKFNDQ